MDRHNLSDEEKALARVREMNDTGEYHPIDLNFVDDLMNRAAELRSKKLGTRKNDESLEDTAVNIG